MRCSPSEVVIRAGHPVARSGVTAEPASPHGVVRPFSVLISRRSSGALVHRALLRPRTLAGSGPWSFPSPTTPQVVSKHGAHPLLGFHSPTGCYRSQPQYREPFHAFGSGPVLSLSWGFHPYSGRQHEGFGYPDGFHTTGTLRPQGSSPSRRLAPLRAFRRLPAGPLLGFRLQGLAPASSYGALSGMSRAFLTLPTPTVAR
jgi:hypothetical protein